MGKRSNPHWTAGYKLFIDNKTMASSIARRKTHKDKQWIKINYPDNKHNKFVMDLVEGYYRVHENAPEEISWHKENKPLMDWIDWFCEEKGFSPCKHILH